MQNRFFCNKFKKVCVLQRRACNEFKRNYLENYNDSEHAVKTKNAPFFMIYSNISFFHMIVFCWSGFFFLFFFVLFFLFFFFFFMKWRDQAMIGQDSCLNSSVLIGIRTGLDQELEQESY